MTSFLHRGFKAQAERKSISIRNSLYLAPMDRLDCLALAKRLGIAVVSLADLQQHGAKARSIEILRDKKNRFSAITICGEKEKRVVVFNPDESPGRTANSLAHELSHAILLHPPAPALGFGGCRSWDPVAEAEADWLAAALLVPRQGVLFFILRKISLQQIADHFGISLQLLNWRIQTTGIERQIAYLRKAQA